MCSECDVECDVYETTLYIALRGNLAYEEQAGSFRVFGVLFGI